VFAGSSRLHRFASLENDVFNVIAGSPRFGAKRHPRTGSAATQISIHYARIQAVSSYNPAPPDWPRDGKVL
jgi:hypothetical protein